VIVNTVIVEGMIMKKKLYFILAVSVFTAGVLAGCGEANTADYNTTAE